jgi:hypothetical protein
VHLRLKELGRSEALEVDRAALDRTRLLKNGLIPEGWVVLHTSANSANVSITGSLEKRSAKAKLSASAARLRFQRQI